jgi:hypothetical protein
LQSVSAFEASKYKITNEEFLEFVKEKGYETQSFWSQEGWNWRQFKKAKHPPFWVCPSECKSGCGTSLKDYSHCQSKHFSSEELDLFGQFAQEENLKNTYENDENGFRKNFPYK